jgi:hypothetical protein
MASFEVYKKETFASIYVGASGKSLVAKAYRQLK